MNDDNAPSNENTASAELADDFLNYSRVYFDCAVQVKGFVESEPYKKAHFSLGPVAFLFSHSAELCLKGFLISEGLTLGELRSKKFGHRLSELLNECRQNERFETLLDDRTLRVLDQMGSLDVWIKSRYPEFPNGQSGIGYSGMMQAVSQLLLVCDAPISEHLAIHFGTKPNEGRRRRLKGDFLPGEELSPYDFLVPPSADFNVLASPESPRKPVSPSRRHGKNNPH